MSSSSPKGVPQLMKARYEVVAVLSWGLLSAISSVTETSLSPSVLVLAGISKILAGRTGSSSSDVKRQGTKAAQSNG